VDARVARGERQPAARPRRRGGDRRFQGGTVQGNAGCNSFNGGYALAGDGLTFGPLGSTMMACEPSQSEVEAAVLSGLEATASYRIEDGMLTLLDDAGGELLVYEVASA